MLTILGHGWAGELGESGSYKRLYVEANTREFDCGEGLDSVAV